MYFRKAEVAEVLGYTIKTVYNKFNGNSDFSIGDITELACHYKVTPSVILSWIQSDRVEGVCQK